MWHEHLVHFKYSIKTYKVATQRSFVRAALTIARGLKLPKLSHKRLVVYYLRGGGRGHFAGGYF